MNKRQIGNQYEQVAAEYLTRQGYRILERNFRSRAGEIDIIAREQAYLVFVEVKYRADDSFGSPFEAVDRRKQQNIIKVAQYYMLRHGYQMESDVRFDVLAILGEKISLIRNAFGV